MVFHWSLCDSKFPQVYRTLFSILGDLNTALVWIVSARPLISHYSGPLTKPLLVVQSAPITIGFILTFMFHRFFSSMAKCNFFFVFFDFSLWLAVTEKSTIFSGSFLLFIYLFFL